MFLFKIFNSDSFQKIISKQIIYIYLFYIQIISGYLFSFYFYSYFSIYLTYIDYLIQIIYTNVNYLVYFHSGNLFSRYFYSDY